MKNLNAVVQYKTRYLISHQTELLVAIIIILIAIFIIQRKGHAEAGDLVWKGRLSGHPGDSSKNASACGGLSLSLTE